MCILEIEQNPRNSRSLAKEPPDLFSVLVSREGVYESNTWSKSVTLKKWNTQLWLILNLQELTKSRGLIEVVCIAIKHTSHSLLSLKYATKLENELQIGYSFNLKARHLNLVVAIWLVEWG
jgi:hypothetical protein